MRHDIVSDALSAIVNAERVGKRACKVPRSKFMLAILEVMKRKGYIEDFEAESRAIVVKLKGKINALAAVKPRFPCEKDGFDKFENRYLPARDIGILLVSTSQGVITHREAKEKNLGGRLVAYVY